MKTTLVLLFCCVAPISAFAGGIVIYEQPYKKFDLENEVSAKLLVNEENPELGRAWVQVTTATQTDKHEDLWLAQTANLNVPGLSYDAKSQTIIYKEEGKTAVICASVQSSKIVQTGRCLLNATSLMKEIDDGFQIQRKKVAKVVLELPEVK